MWRESADVRIVWITVLGMPHLLEHNCYTCKLADVAERISEASNVSIPKVFHAMAVMRRAGIVSACCDKAWVLRKGIQ